ncbi:MAG: hypothetical protein ABJB97_10095 [Acidobacteriota bacterium]
MKAVFVVVSFCALVLIRASMHLEILACAISSLYRSDGLYQAAQTENR